jgi:predicted Zn-dependent protease
MLTRTSRLRLATISPLLLIAIGCSGERPRTTTVAASVATGAPDTTTPQPAAPAPPAAKPVSYETADSAFRAGRYAEAVELFGAYTERKPENPWGFYMLGLASWRAGDLPGAEIAFDEALKVDPKHIKSLFNSTRVLLELGRAEEALERIQAALAIEPASGEAFRLLGRAHAELGATDSAIVAYRRAIALDDHDVWAMNNLGHVYIQLGRYADALPPLARATQLRSNAPAFQNNLGQALERLGYCARARQAYEAALALDSTYEKASVGLDRVAGRADDPALPELDLTEMGRNFQAAVEHWRDLDGADAQETAASPR